MSSQPWNHLGSVLGQFSLTYPHYERYDESKSERHRLKLNAPNLNLNLHIDLKPNYDLLASNFTYLETFKNGSYEIPYTMNDTSCFFRTPTAALSLCNGVVSVCIFFNTKTACLFIKYLSIHLIG